MSDISRAMDTLVRGVLDCCDEPSPQYRKQMIVDVFGVWTEDHPGLMDDTVLCCQCKKPTVAANAFREDRMGYWIWDVCCSHECALVRRKDKP